MNKEQYLMFIEMLDQKLEEWVKQNKKEQKIKTGY